MNSSITFKSTNKVSEGILPAISTHRTARASAALIAARLAGRAVDFVTLLILARLLSPSDFGVVAVAMILVVIVEAVLELPVSQMLIVEQFVDSSLLDTAFTLSIIRGFLLSIIIFSAAWPFAIFYHDIRLFPLICVLAFSPAIRGVQNPGMIKYDKILSYKRQISCDIVSRLISCATSSALAYYTQSYWALAYNTVCTPLFSLVVSFILAPYRPSLTLSKWRMFISFLGWLSAGQIFSAFTWQVDRLTLGLTMSKQDVGRFSMADNLSVLPTQILLSPVTGPLSVSLSKFNQEDYRLRESYLKLLSTVALIGFPALSGLALLADPFIRVALGSSWGDAGPILSWLSIASIPSLLWMPFNTLALSLKKTKLIFNRQLLDFIVKIPFSISLLYLYGIYGTCLARGIAGVVIGAASILAARRIIALPLSAQFSVILRPALACLLMSFILRWPLSYVGDLPTIVDVLCALVILSIGGILIYLLTVWMLWRLMGSPVGGEILIYRLAVRLTKSLTRS